MDDRELGRDDLPFPLDRPLTGADLLRLFPTLLQPMWTTAANACQFFTGTVTAVHNAAPKSVDIELSDHTVLTARYYPGYTPSVGDVVEGIRSPKAVRLLGQPA